MGVPACINQLGLATIANDDDLGNGRVRPTRNLAQDGRETGTPRQARTIRITARGHGLLNEMHLCDLLGSEDHRIREG
mgnify:CR=1 FL=1